MGHYDKAYSELDQKVIAELRNRINQAVDKMTKEELELIYMITSNLKDFSRHIHTMKRIYG